MFRFPVAASALAAVFILLGLQGCQKQAAKTPAPDSSETASGNPASPKPFTLTLSSGGGFSGQTQGFTLTHAGEVKAWQKRPGATESISWTKQAPADSVVAFAKALEAYLGAELKETGNMTTRIQYALPDSTYRWSISGAGASTDAPEPFRTWYARTEAYCRGLAPSP